MKVIKSVQEAGYEYAYHSYRHNFWDKICSFRCGYWSKEKCDIIIIVKTLRGFCIILLDGSSRGSIKKPITKKLLSQFKKAIAGQNVNDAKYYLTLWNNKKNMVEFLIEEDIMLEPHFLNRK